VGILKIEKSDISYIQFWRNCSWLCRYGLETYGKDGQDGEDGDLK